MMFSPALNQIIPWGGLSLAWRDLMSRKWMAKLAAENMPLLNEMNKAVGMYEKEAAKK